jgi:hypothetical protein
MDPASPWSAVCSASPIPRSAPRPNQTSQLKACTAANPDECLHRVTIPNAVFPNAVCNDGSPGVFYVRPGSGDDANKWIVHTQGGGGCGTYEDCLERWCGQQGNLPYKANKMSTDWDGDGVINVHLQAEAEGMSEYAPGNDFKDWTHVWMYYCSSDSWMGRATTVPYTGAVPYTLAHRGHTILSAARRMLRKNAVAGWSTDDGYLVPDLDDATHVVFTGTSAGAKGALQNVDWFMTPLAAPHKYLVLDGNIDVADTVLLSRDIWVDDDGDGIGDDRYYSRRIQMGIDTWTTGRMAAINAFADESCRAVYEPMNRMDRCNNFSSLLLLNYGGVPLIETPTFMRLDLMDSVIAKQWTQVWPDGVTRLLAGQFGPPTDLRDHLQAARETLELLYADHDSVSGVFGPRCGKHVGLEDRVAYALDEAPDTDITTPPPTAIFGTDSTAHEAIWNWLNIAGGGIPLDTHVLDTDDVSVPPVTFSTCY